MKVTVAYDKDKYLTNEDKEMDRCGKEAVKQAIHKTKFLRKPLGCYDTKMKKAYLFYPDGTKVYI